ncbi:hypothetical protein [Streptomyces exfoliatus]|uniref:hypothetical protein n=1 Tax=Streptomyces exfoliatus TaxID=1905 RepID=UPI003D67A036
MLIGTFYAATDGVLMALTGPFLAEGRQAGGLALVQTAQALARLGAAVAFGAPASRASRSARRAVSRLTGAKNR